MKLFVAGHKGMVGSAVVRRLSGEHELIVRTREELDLLNQRSVADFFAKEKPEGVVLAAAKVGGILANSEHQGAFLYENLTIQNNVIHQAFKHDIKRFCFLGSSCIYPKEALQPIKEEALLTGPLEPTNEGYATAKIAGLKLTEYYGGLSLMPCNLYGTNDCYDLYKSHVFPALIRKFIEAKIANLPYVTLWGTGTPRREFMHVDDLANAIAYFLEKDIPYPWINIGWGKDISIAELAALIAEEVGYEGEIRYDSNKPDGTMKKCTDVSKMRKLGFEPQIDLRTGIKQTVAEYHALV